MRYPGIGGSQTANVILAGRGLEEDRKARRGQEKLAKQQLILDSIGLALDTVGTGVGAYQAGQAEKGETLRQIQAIKSREAMTNRQIQAEQQEGRLTRESQEKIAGMKGESSLDEVTAKLLGAIRGAESEGILSDPSLNPQERVNLAEAAARGRPSPIYARRQAIQQAVQPAATAQGIQNFTGEPSQVQQMNRAEFLDLVGTLAIKDDPILLKQGVEELLRANRGQVPPPSGFERIAGAPSFGEALGSIGTAPEGKLPTEELLRLIQAIQSQDQPGANRVLPPLSEATRQYILRRTR